MHKKRSTQKVWTAALCAVLLFSALFLYWYTAKRPAVEIDVMPAKATAPGAPEGPGLSPSATSSTAKTNVTVEKKEIPIAEEQLLQPDEIEEAIAYLEKLVQQTDTTDTETIGAKAQAAENTTGLSQNELLQLIREGVSYYDSLLESGSIDFFLQTTSAGDPSFGIGRLPSGTWQGTFEFSGNRLWMNVKRDVTQYGEYAAELSDTEQFAYDGETFEKLFYSADGQPHIGRSGNSGYKYITFYDPRFWGWDLSGRGSLSSLLDRLNVQNIQPVDWNGSEVYHVTGTRGHATHELWLNPEKSYRPERFMISGSDVGEWDLRVTKDFNFQEVAPDLWFPESAQAFVTIINMTTGVETDIKTDRITFSNIRINEHIPSSRFSVGRPVGSVVHDERTGESFTVGEEENN